MEERFRSGGCEAIVCVSPCEPAFAPILRFGEKSSVWRKIIRRIIRAKTGHHDGVITEYLRPPPHLPVSAVYQAYNRNGS